jgi:hypothetical protein
MSKLFNVQNNPEILEQTINHVFLPPKLPQEAGLESLQKETHLLMCQVAFEAIGQLHQNMPPKDQPRLIHVQKMLLHLQDTIQTPLAEKRLQKDLFQLRVGGEWRSNSLTTLLFSSSFGLELLALYIRAQNACVIVRRHPAKVVFEVFEVSPPIADVIGATGKLICSYPGPAVEVSAEVFSDPFFRSELCNFICDMDVEELDSVPRIRKAGVYVSEVRDTAHPKYISQLLVSILRGCGREAEVQRISKRVADDVLWQDALKPWRRSPIWLIIRVALQTSLPRVTYKSFVLLLNAALLQYSLTEHFSSDLLYTMRAKMARRYKKLEGDAPQFVGKAVLQAAAATEDLLQRRWADVQQKQEGSTVWRPMDLDKRRDTYLTLRGSRSYLLELLHPPSCQPARLSFTPARISRLVSQEFKDYSDHALADAVAVGTHVALADFEHMVQEHLDTWVEDHLHNTSSMEILASCFEQYLTAAQKLYQMDILDQSIMILTAMELWVAMDKVAVNQYKLLRDYSPELPERLLEPLLLRSAKSIQCSARVQTYLRHRHRHAAAQAKLPSIFSDDVSDVSFALKSFHMLPELGRLKLEIERVAAEERVEKRKELDELNKKHNCLSAHATSLEHDYVVNRWGSEVHSYHCGRCSIQRQANEMTIEAHEWPLPEDERQAKRVVFEMACPSVVSIWRAVTYHLLADLGLPERRASFRAEPKVLLSQDRNLAGRGTYHRRNRLTLGSTTKAFIDSHYSSSKLPQNETAILVPNGLHYCLIDTKYSTWAAGSYTKSNMSYYGRLMLPDTPYQYLQYAVEGTSHAPNQILADQSLCPEEISLHEHYAFASLRSGANLQWMNIVRELASTNLSLNRDEVCALVSMAAWQIGELSKDGMYRTWHLDLRSTIFGSSLVTEADKVLRRVSASWLEAGTVRILGKFLLALRDVVYLNTNFITVSLITRLLASMPTPDVCALAYVFLRKARDVMFGWLHQLMLTLQNLESDKALSKFQRLVCETAAICRSTFDVDEHHLDHLLQSHEDVSVALVCAIAIHDNFPQAIQQAPVSEQHLICRDRRLAYKLEPRVRKLLIQDRRGLDKALLQIWSSYRASSNNCLALPPPNKHWITARTAQDGDGLAQQVHFNLLDGLLLVNGKPLGRLPREFVTHPTYIRTLGQVSQFYNHTYLSS